MVRNYSNLIKPPVSKEYGAWASLAITFIIGIGVARRVNLEALILFLGALSFFLARIPFLGILRFPTSNKTKSPEFARQAIWFFLYGFTGIVSFSILLLKYKLTDLSIFITLSLLIFSFNTYVTYKKGRRAKESGFSGVLGVSLLSSFAYYVASGVLDNIVATLWILVFLHLAGGIFYVEARLGVFKQQACLIFHLITAIIVVILSILKFVPPSTIVAYLPAFVKSSSTVFIPASIVSVRRLGRIELFYSVVFASILIVAYLVK